MKPRHVAAILPLALAAACANAAQISQSFTQVETPTTFEWKSFYDFTTFDPTVGTLNAVTLDLSGSFYNSAASNSVESVFSANFIETLSLINGNGAVLKSSLINATVNGTELNKLFTTTTPVSFSYSVSDPNSFVGTGTRTYGMDALLSKVGGSGSDMTLLSSAGGTLRLTYDYTPAVPEPQNYAMFLAGLGLVTATRLFARRRLAKST